MTESWKIQASYSLRGKIISSFYSVTNENQFNALIDKITPLRKKKNFKLVITYENNRD